MNTVIEDAYSVLETGPLSDQYNVANPDAARAALPGESLTLRLGYQSPNPRLAAAVAAITGSCAAAGITVVDVTADGVGPQTLRDGQIDVLLSSIGERRAAVSTGPRPWTTTRCSPATANNLSGCNNPRSTASSRRWR